ncbi:uncharacterized protein LOC135844752 [Planococcus citri]|uniref:uncharacterized protein LOC135844752 n=1 Tax=Planococcus citri TaxID=170843 RepID=UPI0031F98156
MYLEIIFGVMLIGLGLINGEDQSREGKWLLNGRTITSFVHEKSYVTESVASSCVVVQPSLPPCRHVRQLDIRPHRTEKIKITASPELLGVPERTSAGLMYGPRVIFSSNGHRENLERQDNDPKPLSWAEYLGLEDVTVTKTAVHSVTAKYYDPNTVVTFNVRGCHPSKLPFNLPLCNNNATSSSAAVNSLAKEVHYAPYN